MDHRESGELVIPKTPVVPEQGTEDVMIPADALHLVAPLTMTTVSFTSALASSLHFSSTS